MTGIAYFAPHPDAATMEPGTAWWWPGQNGLHYGACLQGLARQDELEPRRYGPDDGGGWWYDQYHLCFMQLRVELDGMPWTDVIDLWNKPHRVVSLARAEGRILHEIPLDQFPDGLTVYDRPGQPMRVVWKDTPRDRKALRQYDQRRARQRPSWRRQTIRRIVRRRPPRISSWKKHQRGDDKRLQETRDFGLPAPHPYWTPQTILLLHEVRDAQFY